MAIRGPSMTSNHWISLSRREDFQTRMSGSRCPCCRKFESFVATPMTHHVVRVTESGEEVSYRCRGCTKVVRSNRYHLMYTNPYIYGSGYYCDGCVGHLTYGHDHYLEVVDGDGRTYTYYDLETITRLYPNLAPRLAKI